MTPDPILTDARAIVSGTFSPWCFDSQIASAKDWRSAAQCALDGDDRDLRLFLEQLEQGRRGYVLTDNEDWKHNRAVAPAVSCKVKEAA